MLGKMFCCKAAKRACDPHGLGKFARTAMQRRSIEQSSILVA
jgi:hypothetical protein